MEKESCEPSMEEWNELERGEAKGEVTEHELERSVLRVRNPWRRCMAREESIVLLVRLGIRKEKKCEITYGI